MGITFILAASFTIISCKKEINTNANENNLQSTTQASGPVTRPYQDNFENALNFVPDIAGGWVAPNPAPAWYPGSGSGVATHLGRANIVFNQYATMSINVTTVAAPVTMFFSSQLTTAGITGIPSSVSSIVYDQTGNSIWFHHTSINTTLVNPTQVDVLGSMDIIGGTGRFANASGQVTLHAQFNPQDLTQSSSHSDGWISY